MCSWCVGSVCLCNGCVAWDRVCPRCHHIRVFYSLSRKGGVRVVD